MFAPVDAVSAEGRAQAKVVVGLGEHDIAVVVDKLRDAFGGAADIFGFAWDWAHEVLVPDQCLVAALSVGVVGVVEDAGLEALAVVQVEQVGQELVLIGYV